MRKIHSAGYQAPEVFVAGPAVVPIACIIELALKTPSPLYFVTSTLQDIAGLIRHYQISAIGYHFPQIM